MLVSVGGAVGIIIAKLLKSVSAGPESATLMTKKRNKTSRPDSECGQWPVWPVVL